MPPCRVILAGVCLGGASVASFVRCPVPAIPVRYGQSVPRRKNIESVGEGRRPTPSEFQTPPQRHVLLDYPPYPRRYRESAPTV